MKKKLNTFNTTYNLYLLIMRLLKSEKLERKRKFQQNEVDSIPLIVDMGGRGKGEWG